MGFIVVCGCERVLDIEVTDEDASEFGLKVDGDDFNVVLDGVDSKLESVVVVNVDDIAVALVDGKVVVVVVADEIVVVVVDGVVIVDGNVVVVAVDGITVVVVDVVGVVDGIVVVVVVDGIFVVVVDVVVMVDGRVMVVVVEDRAVVVVDVVVDGNMKVVADDKVVVADEAVVFCNNIVVRPLQVKQQSPCRSEFRQSEDEQFSTLSPYSHPKIQKKMQCTRSVNFPLHIRNNHPERNIDLMFPSQQFVLTKHR